ncbi:hypothetical protein AB6C47_018145 [Vibrio cyclitrophicus]
MSINRDNTTFKKAIAISIIFALGSSFIFNWLFADLVDWLQPNSNDYVVTLTYAIGTIMFLGTLYAWYTNED